MNYQWFTHSVKTGNFTILRIYVNEFLEDSQNSFMETGNLTYLKTINYGIDLD